MNEASGLIREGYRATAGLPGRRGVWATADELVEALCGDLMGWAVDAVAARGVFHLALSGGRTPEALFRRLMIDPRYRLLPWGRTHLWIVDERCVDVGSEKYNFKMIRETLVDHIEIPAEQVHRMETELGDGDVRYEAALRGALGAGGALDVVLLGMGPDGHTASLFPQTAALWERERWVVFNDGERVVEPRPRMTMTYPLINGARKIVVMLTGAGKHEMIQRIIGTGKDVGELPITGVEAAHPEGELIWYLDLGAAVGRE